MTNATDAAAQAGSTACKNLPRNPNSGGALTTQVSYDNQAVVSTSGVDFTRELARAAGGHGPAQHPGGIGVSLQGTWLDYYKTKQSPASYDPEVNWKGSLGPNLQGFNAGAYSYRLFTSISYNLPDVSVSLRWRHLPSVDVAAQAQQDAIVANNKAVTNGAPGTLLSYTPISAEAAHGLRRVRPVGLLDDQREAVVPLRHRQRVQRGSGDHRQEQGLPV
ncbi:MAG: hypothetical protein WDO12_05630 [Pseudomonadota bacterium]